MPTTQPPIHRGSVLVTGASGYLGNAIARAYVAAGWTTYGLVRRHSAMQELEKEEIIPIHGSPSDLSFIGSHEARISSLDVLVSCTQDLQDMEKHSQAILDMIRDIVSTRARNASSSARLLVIMTSGCKDYGVTALHNDPSLQPSTESSPLNGPPIILPRALSSLAVLSESEKPDSGFDALLTRATTFYGRSQGQYAVLFQLAEEASKRQDKTLTLPSDPNSILHGTHVDDVASAYVSLSSFGIRERVLQAGGIYNISSHRYETLSEVAEALENSYGIKVVYSLPNEDSSKSLFSDPSAKLDLLHLTCNFPQWVASDKLRSVTGWTDTRPLFTGALDVYRASYEATQKSG